MYHRNVYVYKVVQKNAKRFWLCNFRYIANFYALFKTILISDLILLLINLNMKCHNIFDLP